MPTGASTFSPFAATPEMQPSRKMSQTPTQTSDFALAAALGEVRQRSPLPPHSTPPPIMAPEGA
jgi:hypothetical protein